MANLFDVNNAPTSEPTQLVAGDFAQWKRTDLVVSYPRASFTLKYIIRSTTASSLEIQLSQSPASTDDFYLFTLTSAKSSVLSKGRYAWQLEVTEISSGNRIVVDRGELEVKIDLDNKSAEARNHAEVMLDKIQSLLEGRVDSDVASYSIAGRSLTKLSVSELIQARNMYRKEVNEYRAKEAMARGKTSRATIKVRFQ